MMVLCDARAVTVLTVSRVWGVCQRQKSAAGARLSPNHEGPNHLCAARSSAHSVFGNSSKGRKGWFAFTVHTSTPHAKGWELFIWEL
jgi:hypothetical protein